MRRIPGRHFLRNLIERRTLIFQLVRRDFEQRYIGSAAGWLWGVVHPLVLLWSWYFVFAICAKIQLPPGSLTSNYWMFVFCGMLPWLLFQDTVIRSAGALIEQSNLITKTIFPAEVIPVSIFLSSLIHHLIALALAIACAVIFEGKLSPMVLLLPVYMVFVGLLGVGVGWIASSLHVYLRDTAQVVTVVMTLWFWMTPIMINEQSVPQRFRPVIALNPMARIVDAYRQRLLSPQWPQWHELGILAVYCAGVFIAGGLFFRHLKHGFADVL